MPLVEVVPGVKTGDDFTETMEALMLALTFCFSEMYIRRRRRIALASFFHLVKDYDQGYEKVINFGWGIFGWIGRGVVVPIFNWLEGYGLGYGLIILIMVLIIKGAMSPLTFASYRSMAKMRVLKPQLAAKT